LYQLVLPKTTMRKNVLRQNGCDK